MSEAYAFPWASFATPLLLNGLVAPNLLHFLSRSAAVVVPFAIVAAALFLAVEPRRDIMIRKVECVGRATVNECSISLDLVYLGNTGTYIRMGQRSGISGYIVGNTSSVGIGQRSGVVFGKSDFQASIVFPSITEFTYPIDSRSIDFQGTKFQVTDIEDVRIKFRLVDIPINGCNKVNGQEVSQEGPTKSE